MKHMREITQGHLYVYEKDDITTVFEAFKLNYSSNDYFWSTIILACNKEYSSDPLVKKESLSYIHEVTPQDLPLYIGLKFKSVRFEKKIKGLLDNSTKE